MSEFFEQIEGGTELVVSISPEQKRRFVENFYGTGDPKKALAMAMREEPCDFHQELAQRLLAEDEFVRGLMSQAQNLVVNDLSVAKAQSAEILADIRERAMDMEKPNASVMAEIARGKLLGLYTDPKERAAEVLKIFEASAMSEEQLESIIDQFRAMPLEMRRHIAFIIYDKERDEPDVIEAKPV